MRDVVHPRARSGHGDIVSGVDQPAADDATILGDEIARDLTSCVNFARRMTGMLASPSRPAEESGVPRFTRGILQAPLTAPTLLQFEREAVTAAADPTVYRVNLAQ